MATTTRALIYARISQDREGAGLGIERQVADCRDLASRLGYEVVTVFADNDLSAYSGKPRPGYRALLEALETGRATAVLAWHTDRLHRSPAELEEYISVCDPRNVVTHTVKAGHLDLSTPSGRMVARQLGAVARFESEHKADRVRAARLQAAQQGRWQGGARPFGFEKDGQTVRADEAAQILKATHAILAGASLRSVVRDINEAGFRTTFGKLKWDTPSFKDVLLRPRNAGLAVYKGEIIGPAVWPAIVPEETWRAMVSILSNPSRRTSPGGRVRWLGSGLYVCGVCEQPQLRVGTAGSQRKPAYRCAARFAENTTGHVVRDAALLDEFVEWVIVRRLQEPDAADLLEAPAQGVDTTKLQAEALTVRQRLEDLDDDLDEERITRARWLRRNERLKVRLAEIETALASAAQVNPFIGVVGASDVPAVWFGTKPDRSDGLDLGRRRAILDALLTVTVLPTGRGRRANGTYFDPKSVDIQRKR